MELGVFIPIGNNGYLEAPRHRRTLLIESRL